MVERERSDRDADAILVKQIRDGNADAWRMLIDRYEGRLLAYVGRRLKDRATSEDVVQEAFIGFLTSLPNYDGGRSLEAYLFSICGYKLTDQLRRQGRRILGPLGHGGDASAAPDPVARRAGASTIARSGERRSLESEAVARAIGEQVQRWRRDGNWSKLQAIELLMVCGWSNKRVAQTLDLTQQQVANLKSDFQIRLRSVIARMGLDAAVFPELADPS